MRAILAIGILLAAILLFGCIGSSNNQGANIGTGTQQGTSENAGSTPGTGDDPTGGTGGVVVADFDATIAQKCVIKEKATGEAATYYIDGKGNMRVEAQVQGMQIVTIVKDKTLYTRATSEMKSSQMFKDCEWLSIDSSKAEGTPSDQTENVNTNLREMVSMAAKYEVACTPQIVDPSLVTPSGKVCDLTEMMNQATKNPCAVITDMQQRADCEKAMAGSYQ